MRACPACHRHVRSNETAFPFCEAALEPLRCADAPRTGARTRAALVFAGVATVAACRDPGPVALYGPPPMPPSVTPDGGAPDTVAAPDAAADSRRGADHEK